MVTIYRFFAVANVLAAINAIAAGLPWLVLANAAAIVFLLVVDAIDTGWWTRLRTAKSRRFRRMLSVARRARMRGVVAGVFEAREEIKRRAFVIAKTLDARIEVRKAQEVSAN